MNSLFTKLDIGPTDRTDDVTSVPQRIWRRRLLFANVLALTALAVIVLITLWRPSYYASGTVIIGDPQPTDGALSAWAQRFGDPADLESQLLIARSTRILRLALERPGVLDAVYEQCHQHGGVGQILEAIGFLLPTRDCTNLKPASEALLNYVKPGYVVQSEGRSRIISIGYRSPLPEVSFILANALLVTYLEDQRAENAQAREAAERWVLNLGKNTTSGQPADSTNTSKIAFYQDLHNKTKDFETERRNIPNPARLVSLAELPSDPDAPRRLSILVAGLLIATLLSGFVAWRRDFTDQSIRRTRDLENLMSERVLGSLPQVQSPQHRNILPQFFRPGGGMPSKEPIALLAAVGGEWKSENLARAAHALYARLLLELNEISGKTVLVASSAQGEGKTFTAQAVARAAAENKHKVLVINCDLQTRADDCSPSGCRGLADILRGEVEPQAVVETRQWFDVIPAGVADVDPAILMMDGQLPKLLDWAGRYDLVLMDGPAGFSPAARILLSNADGLLWCVRWGHTTLSDVQAALDHLHRHRTKLLGVAVSMVDEREVSSRAIANFW